MKFLLAVLFGVPLAMGVSAGVAVGNPFAIGIALGVLGPAVFFLTTAALGGLMRAAPAPHKADPAKIARLERELLDDASEAPTRASIYNRDGTVRNDVCWGCRMPATATNAGWPVCATCREENVGVDSQGSTRSVARQGPSATFHGAPTFGHKIEGP